MIETKLDIPCIWGGTLTGILLKNDTGTKERLSQPTMKIIGVHGWLDNLNSMLPLARKLLEAAVKSDELLSSTTSNQKLLFFTVYTFFEEYFQRTTTISALAQVPNSNEQKDELERFRSLFDLHFRNQDNDTTNVQ